MIQIVKSVGLMLLLVGMFYLWGESFTRLLKINISNKTYNIILGFFVFFIIAELIIIPMIMLYNHLEVIAGIIMVIAIIITIMSVIIIAKGTKSHRVNQFHWLHVLAFASVFGLVFVSYNMMYRGYDPCYYIGEMSTFVYDKSFWTRDAFVGLRYTDVIPLHYALSCYYPVWAIWAYVTGIPVRILVMHTVKGLCVILFACVCYCWGYELFGLNGDDLKTTDKAPMLGSLFVIVVCVLCFYLSDEHSLVGMMLMRGYESKGFCAAVVAPMCTLMLIKLCRNYKDQFTWKMLAVTAWASMPVAMSSMAVIPLAIGIVGLALMIINREFKYIFIRCAICVAPNVLLMAWYILGK